MITNKEVRIVLWFFLVLIGLAIVIVFSNWRRSIAMKMREHNVWLWLIVGTVLFAFLLYGFSAKASVNEDADVKVEYIQPNTLICSTLSQVTLFFRLLKDNPELDTVSLAIIVNYSVGDNRACGIIDIPLQVKNKKKVARVYYLEEEIIIYSALVYFLNNTTSTQYTYEVVKPEGQGI